MDGVEFEFPCRSNSSNITLVVLSELPWKKIIARHDLIGVVGSSIRVNRLLHTKRESV